MRKSGAVSWKYYDDIRQSALELYNAASPVWLFVRCERFHEVLNLISRLSSCSTHELQR